MPAVTRVEECTKDDTGVGAAMAAGSQALKGIWALLVQAAMRIRSKEEDVILLEKKVISGCLVGG